MLLGVTGSGKTFTMAQVIEKTQQPPALILAPKNKTLAAQLYSEFKSFFPDNAVEYFVSYYDNYQPEAYVPRTDTYIAKESTINEEIDRMRHAATRALLERDDVIIVASVLLHLRHRLGRDLYRHELRHRGGRADRPAPADRRPHSPAIQADEHGFLARHIPCSGRRDRTLSGPLGGSRLAHRPLRRRGGGNREFDPLTGHKNARPKFVKVYANSHYVTPRPTLDQAVNGIKAELKERLAELNRQNRFIEAQRLEQRTQFDLEMLQATGVCQGIENYSRYLTGRNPGDPPPTLLNTCRITRSFSPTRAM